MVQPHSERAHAKFNSSGAHRWTVCLGQPNLAAQFPEPPSSRDALAGTQAHEILEMCLSAAIGGVPAEPHKYTNSPEIIASINAVLDYLARLRAEAPDLHVTAEQRVWFPQDVVAKTECGGTLDIMAYSPNQRRAWIVDFKHGAGVPVEVVGNKQLLMYAAAALWTMELAEAVLVIIQPRAQHRLGPVREWIIGPVEIVDFVSDVDDALRAAIRPDAPLVPGDHCRWCPAIHGCDARDTHALAAMQQDFAHVKDLDLWAPPEPKAVPLEKLLLIKRHSQQVRQWLDAIDDYLLSSALHGLDVPGYKLVEAQGRRKWLSDEDKVASELIALSEHTLSIDDVRPRKLATITDMDEQLVRIAVANVPHGWKDKAASAMRDRLAYLTVKSGSGNLTLVPDTDHRPSTSKIAQDFGHVVAGLEPVETPQLVYGALPAPVVDPQSLIHKD